MRISHSNQGRLDCEPIHEVSLNLDCRDEIIPVLYALQHIYKVPSLRDKIMALVGDDVNRSSSSERGRDGLSYWEILVLAAVRLSCNLDYDRLQDLAENHLKLRAIMGIGDWDERQFKWKRIRDNIAHLSIETIKKISDLIVEQGHELAPDAVKKVRVDSFVVETNIHHPTESSLIYDGIRKVLEVVANLVEEHNVKGWRQHAHLMRKVKMLHANIGRRSQSKAPGTKEAVKDDYRELLKTAGIILDRAEETAEQVSSRASAILSVARIDHFVRLTRIVCNTAFRRVELGETVPNSDKLFSIFEPHTQLYKRGKAGQDKQFGRLVLIFEDGAGFIVHGQLMGRTQLDEQVAVPQSRLVQEKLNGKVQRMTFDRGFFSAENEQPLAEIVDAPCLPKRHPTAYAEQLQNATIEFHDARRWHSGVESTIGALQSGNGLKRCRDRTEDGFERYLHLAIVGRNLHVLGKMLIAQKAPDSLAASTLRKCD